MRGRKGKGKERGKRKEGNHGRCYHLFSYTYLSYHSVFQVPPISDVDTPYKRNSVDSFTYHLSYS